MPFLPLHEFWKAPGFWSVVAVLAAWRLTSILHSERIARPFRKLFGVSEEGELWRYPDTFWGYLISCFWCLSVWVSVFVLMVVFLCPYLLLPFALSAGAILLNSLIGGVNG